MHITKYVISHSKKRNKNSSSLKEVNNTCDNFTKMLFTVQWHQRDLLQCKLFIVLVELNKQLKIELYTYNFQTKWTANMELYSRLFISTISVEVLSCHFY